MSAQLEYQTRLEEFCNGCPNYDPCISIDRRVNGVPISAAITCSHLDACSGVVVRMRDSFAQASTADPNGDDDATSVTYDTVDT